MLSGSSFREKCVENWPKIAFDLQDLKSIKENYAFMLDNLIDGHEVKEWGLVKMIDFAHVFPAEADCLDSNYLFGVENLVKVFEDFLKECD